MTADNDALKGSFRRVLHESSQAFELRQPLYRRLRELREGRAVVSFFVSFLRSDAMFEQIDADMIEEVLINADCSKGISLILNAPGGDGIAAERVIKICRSYSGGDFETIVPARSKSAATIVCLGSDRILMSPTSELGPVDPQVPYDIGLERPVLLPADTIVKSFDDLFERAGEVDSDTRIEPYLQQLSKFNNVYIEELRKAQKLSDDIALNSAKQSMLRTKSDEEVRELLKPFTDPGETKDHGRGIFWDQAKECGLNVEKIDLNRELWSVIWALYRRCDYVLQHLASVGKLVETADDSYYAS